MAWIESHQSLLTHRKTIQAAAELRISRHLLIGHLHALWWWSLDNAEDNGSLGRVTPEIVAEAAGWPQRKASAFAAALLNAGFLDGSRGAFVLHNWYKYAGKLNEKRAKDRDRKKEVAAISSGIPTEVAGKSQAPTNQPTNQTNLTHHTNPADEAAAVFASFGTVTSGTVRAINEDVEDFSAEWVLLAVKQASRSAFEGQPGWNYVHSILERWKVQGGPDEPRLQAVSKPTGRRNGGASADTDLAGWREYKAGEA